MHVHSARSFFVVLCFFFPVVIYLLAVNERMNSKCALDNLLKRKRNSVPRAVNCWLFFKRHILEKTNKVRTLFEKALTLDEFKFLVRSNANPLKFGPSFCRRRRSQKTNTRCIQDLLLVAWQYYLALLHPASPIYVSSSKLMSVVVVLEYFIETIQRKDSNNEILCSKNIFTEYFPKWIMMTFES